MGRHTVATLLKRGKKSFRIPKKLSWKTLKPTKKQLNRVANGSLAVLVGISIFSLPFMLNADSVEAFTGSQGPRFATATGDCVNDSSNGGTVAWTSPGNVFSSNDTYASATLGSATTHFAKCTNFGFTLPAGVTIAGITATVEHYGSGANKVFDGRVSLVKGGTAETTNYASATGWDNADEVFTYGSSSDLWSSTWTASDINASNFGIAVAATRSGGGSNIAYLDSVSITVDYSFTPTFNQSSYRWFENDASGTGTFTRLWGDSGDDRANSVVQTSDGGYAVTGSTASYGSGNTDMFLAKYTSAGTLSWTKAWGGTNDDYGNSVVQTSDNGYAVTGFTKSYGDTSYGDMFLAKYTSDGTLSWSRTWGGSLARDDYGSSVVQTSDGGYAVTGSAKITGYVTPVVFLAKYTSAGSLSWDRTWGGTLLDRGNAIIQTSDSGYAVTGITYSFDDITNGDMFLAKFASDGTFSWSETWGDINASEGASLVQTSDGGYAVTGTTSDYGFPDDRMFLAKYTTSGTLSWSQIWGDTGSDGGNSVVQTSDSGYAVTGYTANYGAGSNDIFLAKYTSTGTLSWSKTWGGTGADHGRSVVQTSDDGFAVAGDTNSYGAGGTDMVLLRYDSSGAISGCSSPTCQSPTATNSSESVTNASQTASEAAVSASTSSPVPTQTTIPVTVDIGPPVAAQDTAITALSGIFRLRMNLHVSGDVAVGGSNHNFKLQYAERGTDNLCDTSFTGETYADVTTSTPVAYADNINATDGMALAINVNDPTHSTDTLVRQEYNEANNTSVVNTTVAGEDAMWDFALTADDADANITYCMRMVYSWGGALAGYTVVPQLTIPDVDFDQSGYRWYENQDATTTNTFAQVWGGTGTEYAYSTVHTSDGGYAVTGETSSYGAGGVDMFLAKYTSDGTLSWSKTWGGTSTDRGHALIQTSDGGYAVTGETYSFGAGAGFYDMFLAKYTSDGTLSWSKTWGSGGTTYDYGYSLVQTSDGGYAVTGTTDSFGVSGDDMFLAKYTSDGTLSWSKTWGGPGDDVGHSLIQTADGGYVVTGETNSFTTGYGYDMFLAKYTSDGTLSWSKTWGGTTDHDYGYSIVQTNDGGYAVTGHCGSFFGGVMFLAKYTSDGTLSWSRLIDGGVIRGRSLVQATDGGYVIVGDGPIVGGGAGLREIVLVKYTGDGVLSWSKSWGSTGDDYGYSLDQASDGGYAVTGYTAGYGAGNSDMILLKYDADGNIANCGPAMCQTGGTDFTTEDYVDGTDYTSTEEVDGTDYTSSNTSPTASEEVDGTDYTSVNKADTIGGGSDYTSETEIITGHVTFAKTWGGTGDDYGYSLVQTSDGGYAVTGYTYSYGAGSTDMFLAKYTSTGTLSWSKTWGGTSSEQGYSLVQTSDGGYAVTGYTYSYGDINGDMFLAKYTSTGTLSWSKTWGGTSFDGGHSLVQTSDGGYAVTGQTGSYGAGSTDMFLAKYTSTGTLSWSKTWGGTGDDCSSLSYTRCSLVQTSDGGYAVTGKTGSYGAGGYDMFLTKYTSTGTLSWSKTWGGTGAEYGQSLVQTSDGGYAVTGQTGSYGAGSTDMFLAKYASDGTLSWSKTWGGTGAEYGQSLVQTSDGGYAVTGQTGSYGAGSTDMFLAKYTSTGTLSWSKTWGGTGDGYGWTLVQTSDGGYAVTGETASYGAGSIDMFLAKYSATGEIVGCASSMCKADTVGGGSDYTSETNVDGTDYTSTEEVDGVDYTSTQEVDGTDYTSTNTSPTATENVDGTDYTSTNTYQATLNLWSHDVPNVTMPLGASDTAASQTRRDTPVRLRFLLDPTTRDVSPASTSLKLQVSPKVGICDASFTGETYVDISGAAAYNFYNNTNLTDGDWIYASSIDPDDSNTIFLQQYEESAPFTNQTSLLTAGHSGLWDVSLTANEDTLGGNYCFRVVLSDGTPLGTYSEIPELFLPPHQSQLLRHGQWFDSGETKQPFYW